MVLTQAADGAVVRLVAQGVGTGVAEAEVSAGQDEGVPQVREAHHTLVAVVTVLIITGLCEGREEAVGVCVCVCMATAPPPKGRAGGGSLTLVSWLFLFSMP